MGARNYLELEQILPVSPTTYRRYSGASKYLGTRGSLPWLLTEILEILERIREDDGSLHRLSQSLVHLSPRFSLAIGPLEVQIRNLRSK